MVNEMRIWKGEIKMANPVKLYHNGKTYCAVHNCGGSGRLLLIGQSLTAWETERRVIDTVYATECYLKEHGYQPIEC